VQFILSDTAKDFPLSNFCSPSTLWRQETSFYKKNNLRDWTKICFEDCERRRSNSILESASWTL